MRGWEPSRAAIAAAALGAAVGLAALSQGASAKPAFSGKTFVPRHGKLYHGVSDTGELRDFRHFRKRVRAHPAVLQEFYHWDVSLKASGAFRRWNRSRTLGVVSMSTKNPAGGASEITPGKIAAGRGDHYLLRLNESIANRGRPVYIRLFPEMNGHWNPYCAFNADGSHRGRAHRTSRFRKAWRRTVIIVRGGPRKRVNRRLRNNGLPLIHRAKRNRGRFYRRRDVPTRLEPAPVSFMWVPQSFGSPNIRGNQPRAYWPGRRFVDWVGADIYSKYASAFDDLIRFQRRYRGFPFVIGEYSPWDNDFSGSFTRRLHRWARGKPRVRMLIYYRSVTADNPFYITHYPGAKRALRTSLNKRRFDEFGPRTRGRRR
jgi:hypothetical protein